VGKHLAQGVGRPRRRAAIEEFVAQFTALGGYFADRVTDLRDAGSRTWRQLGKAAPGVPA
jgi:phosphotransferase system enzyme I (PtsI)